MKILFQKSWSQDAGWNDQLDSETVDLFRIWIRELLKVEFLEIPRKVMVDTRKACKLVLFTDASEQAMCACIYVVVWDAPRPVSRLLCAKTKLAPKKMQTLPRLELAAMALGSKLLIAVEAAVERKNAFCINPPDAYTDSTTALVWVKGDPARWNTFVANRVAQIQRDWPEISWSHVSGPENPADLATRYKLHDLQNLDFWWTGPEWLKNREHWNCQPYVDPTTVPDRKRVKVLTTTVKDVGNGVIPIKDCGTLDKVIKITKVLLTWPRRTPCVPMEDVMAAIIRQDQCYHFPDEMSDLQEGRQVCSTSPLYKLSPVLWPNGTMRVGGRLTNADLALDARRPAILSGKSHLAKLIVTRTHLKLYHAGSGPVRVELLKHYWITGVKTLVRAAIHDCTSCARYNVKPIIPLMGDLPEARVRPSPPFTHVGLDYAGPFTCGTGTPGETCKRYILVFVCFATKAVHMEVTRNVDIAETLLALRAFMARRGVPRSIYSDNGTGLLGARRKLCEFRKMFESKWGDKTGAEYLLQLGVNWYAIPPSAPHMGGIWESAVKSAKGLIKRSFGQAVLSEHFLRLVVMEAEAILNSRPLGELPDDPDTLQPLTPSMLITGFKHDLFPVLPGRKPDELAVSQNPYQRYRYLQTLIADFWKRWKTEYLAILHTRGKSLKFTPNIAIGELVLVADEDTPPGKWPMARVLKTYPGDDGVVRAVKLKTQRGETSRPRSQAQATSVTLELATTQE